MNYKPKTYLKTVRYYAPAVWETYLTTGRTNRMSAAHKAACDKFLSEVNGTVHFVIPGAKQQGLTLTFPGCRPSKGMLYTVLYQPHGKGAPPVVPLLRACEAFVSGFEGDESQEGIDGDDGLLARLRNAVAMLPFV